MRSHTEPEVFYPAVQCENGYKNPRFRARQTCVLLSTRSRSMARDRFYDDEAPDIRRSRRRQDDDDDYDPRPSADLRRGRPESYTGLIIGLAVGVGVLVLLIIGVLVIVEATSEPQPPFVVM